MNEQLVSFEVAKLAKEVGFNWKCNFYDEYITVYEVQNVKYNRKKFGIYEDWNHKKYGKAFTSLPTQSLLQKWLRDIHGIAVHISTDITLSWIYTIQSLHPQATYTGLTIHSEQVFSTYEESLEKGLYRALKLINRKPN
jgi:hypothetical protein